MNEEGKPEIIFSHYLSVLIFFQAFLVHTYSVVYLRVQLGLLAFSDCNGSPTTKLFTN
jgi:hypothetical protein